MKTAKEIDKDLNLQSMADKQIRRMFFYIIGFCNDNEEFCEALQAAYNNVTVKENWFNSVEDGNSEEEES